MNESEINLLAESLGVTPADLLCMAQSVANSIDKDGAKKAFLEMNDYDKTETATAYVANSVRKFNQFTSTYLTNQQSRQAFQSNVLSLIQ
jgi:hypothetical protein